SDPSTIAIYPLSLHDALPIFFREYADKNKVPVLAAFGGSETLYPEIFAAVKDTAAAEAAAKAKMVPSGPPQASRAPDPTPNDGRSEEHTSELSHVEISYAVFC